MAADRDVQHRAGVPADGGRRRRLPGRGPRFSRRGEGERKRRVQEGRHRFAHRLSRRVRHGLVRGVRGRRDPARRGAEQRFRGVRRRQRDQRRVAQPGRGGGRVERRARRFGEAGHRRFGGRGGPSERHRLQRAESLRHPARLGFRRAAGQGCQRGGDGARIGRFVREAELGEQSGQVGEAEAQPARASAAEAIERADGDRAGPGVARGVEAAVRLQERRQVQHESRLGPCRVAAPRFAARAAAAREQQRAQRFGELGGAVAVERARRRAAGRDPCDPRFGGARQRNRARAWNERGQRRGGAGLPIPA